MSVAALEKLIWLLIFGGLLSLGLGVSLVRGDAGWGWAVVAVGGAAAVVGTVLIFVRARLREPQ